MSRRPGALLPSSLRRPLGPSSPTLKRPPSIEPTAHAFLCAALALDVRLKRPLLPGPLASRSPRLGLSDPLWSTWYLAVHAHARSRSLTHARSLLVDNTHTHARTHAHARTQPCTQARPHTPRPRGLAQYLTILRPPVPPFALGCCSPSSSRLLKTRPLLPMFWPYCSFETLSVLPVFITLLYGASISC